MRLTLRLVRWSIITILALCGNGIAQMDQNPTKQAVRGVIRSANNAVPSKCDVWMQLASDRSQGAQIRIEASLAKECVEQHIHQRLGWIVDNESDDIAVRSATVAVLPRWGDTPLQMVTILRALSLPGVRTAAIGTLEKMGQVTGDKESRLLATLADLRGGAADPYKVSGLPMLYGRDLRILDFLTEQFRRGNRWERALAASELFALGEIETALEAARDPEARVRRSLAAAIGWYREPRGVPVLEQLAGDADRGVANQARASLSRLGVAAGAPPHSDEFQWSPFLKELSEFRLSNPRVAAAVSEQKVKAGWLGELPATEQQIVALERRLGRSLPPSYRSFLTTSNGFHQPNSFIPRLYGSDEVGRFGERNKEWVEAFRESYLNLGSWVQISDVGDAAVVMLNPDVVSRDGEWQTNFFATWNPGARPYRSFREFMEQELNGRCEWRNQ